MQHIYGNHANDSEFYGQSIPLYPHQQYQHERHSVSPQQSSTSDADEVSPIPSNSASRVNPTIANKVTKKKKPTKKKRKDPNEPQKPVSPYALFFRDAQNDIKKKLANPSFGEISKVVAHMWENIEPEVKEQYKRKAATAKKEYLKQLAAYRAVQVAHQAPNLPHFLTQTSLPFNTHSLHHQQKPYHSASVITNNPHPHHPSFAQFCPSATSSVPHQTPSYNNFHYLNPYAHDNSNLCHSDPQNYFSNPTHQTYHSYDSYDSNNNYPEYHHYGLLRPAIDSEHYSSYYSSASIDGDHIKTNENLLHNLNNNTSGYGDVTSINNGLMEKHYDYANPVHYGLPERKEEEHSAMAAICSENHFHWN